MGKPRLIILIRHAQSEGNKNRAIHQLVPDHRVKLTDEGWKQATEAGQRLRELLLPTDTLQLFTSPYRRTRETTEALLTSLTANDATTGPSPFSREKITVYEEPRLREQDFGNFQPDSAEMERMWKERANYGHFFYRIPNGESAADAYDRISGFNESLWRQFGEKDFPSVLVLVTHGLMTRVFLMKWYHWSVEYFEDLRNINHCEFMIMKQKPETGKYILESQLRTWSELKRQRAKEAQEKEKERAASVVSVPLRRNTLSAFLRRPLRSNAEGRHDDDVEVHGNGEGDGGEENEADDHPLGTQEPQPNSASATTDGATDNLTMKPSPRFNLPFRPNSIPSHITPRPESGTSTPHEMPSDDEGDYFDPKTNPSSSAPRGRDLLAAAFKKPPERKPTPEDIERWVGESGMGEGRRADALGDEPAPDEQAEEANGGRGGGNGGVSGSFSEDVQKGREIGRNAVERMVEEQMSNEGSARGSVY